MKQQIKWITVTLSPHPWPCSHQPPVLEPEMKDIGTSCHLLVLGLVDVLRQAAGHQRSKKLENINTLIGFSLMLI